MPEDFLEHQIMLGIEVAHDGNLARLPELGNGKAHGKAHGPRPPEALAACFGRKSHKRTAQITAILDTLKALGHIT